LAHSLRAAAAQDHAHGPGGAGAAQGYFEFAVDASGVPVHHHQMGGEAGQCCLQQPGPQRHEFVHG
jgi:hypothetical protein